MISHKFILFAIIYFITIQALLFGSGFAIYEHGISANGLAGAFGGISKKMSDQLTVNLSFIYLFFEEREITNSKLDSPLIGTYNGSAELIGLGIKYDF